MAEATVVVEVDMEGVEAEAVTVEVAPLEEAAMVLLRRLCQPLEPPPRHMMSMATPAIAAGQFSHPQLSFILLVLFYFTFSTLRMSVKTFNWMMNEKRGRGRKAL